MEAGVWLPVPGVLLSVAGVLSPPLGVLLSPPPPQAVAGTLADYYDSDANPLFELEIDGRRVLVPAVEEFIAHIDFEGRNIRMILPDGLLELD